MTKVNERKQKQAIGKVPSQNYPPMRASPLLVFKKRPGQVEYQANISHGVATNYYYQQRGIELNAQR